MGVTLKMKNIITILTFIIFATGCASSNLKKSACPKDKLIEYYDSKGSLNKVNNNRTLGEVYFIVGCNGKKIKNIHSRYQKIKNIGWGKIIYEFTILSNGSVPSATVVKSDFDDKEFEYELENTIKSMKFSKKNIDKFIVTLPIEFREKM